MAGMAQRKISSFFSSSRAAPASNAVNAVDPQRRSGLSQSDGVTTECQPLDRTAGTKEGCADGRGEWGLIQPDCRPGPSDAGSVNNSPTASSHEGDSDMSDESESETLTDKRPSKKSSDIVPPSRKYEAKRKRCFLEKWRTDYNFVDYDYQAEMIYCKKCRAMPTLAKGNAPFHGVTEIGECMKEESVAKVRQARFFSVMSDSSMDRSILDQELVYMTDLEDGVTVSRLVNIVSLQHAHATGITDAILEGLENVAVTRDDLRRRLVGFGSDGASVMIGVNNGVAAKLKKFCPSVVSVWRVAHRLQLAALDTIKHNPLQAELKETLKSIYKHYIESAKATRELRKSRKADFKAASQENKRIKEEEPQLYKKFQQEGRQAPKTNIEYLDKRKRQQHAQKKYKNLKAALDSVHRPSLWKLLRARDVADKIISLIQELYTDTTSCVRVGTNHSDWFKLLSSVRQDMDYADDVALLAELLDALVSTLEVFSAESQNLDDLDAMTNEAIDNLDLDTSDRLVVVPGLKLAITLRLLATRNSYRSLGYEFRVAYNGICQFVPEVCSAIHRCLCGRQGEKERGQAAWRLRDKRIDPGFASPALKGRNTLTRPPRSLWDHLPSNKFKRNISELPDGIIHMEETSWWTEETAHGNCLPLAVMQYNSRAQLHGQMVHVVVVAMDGVEGHMYTSGTNKDIVFGAMRKLYPRLAYEFLEDKKRSVTASFSPGLTEVQQ
ncbi:hypothetical protein Bbelb_019420 [Branchiostoma belcheri]|nr:hypothetical protein Bbelb_019420 [Branchiostoma belcheri]